MAYLSSIHLTVRFRRRVSRPGAGNDQPDGAATGASKVAGQASYLGRGSGGAFTDRRALRARCPAAPGAQSDAAPVDATKSAAKDTEGSAIRPAGSAVTGRLLQRRGCERSSRCSSPVALLPSLTLGGMLWLGAIKTPWSTGAHAEDAPLPAAKASLAATTPAPDRVQSTAGRCTLERSPSPRLTRSMHEAGGEIAFCRGTRPRRFIACPQRHRRRRAAARLQPCRRGVPMARRNGT